MENKISWSANPGCFESHLMRKYRNPLFSEKERVVTASDVASARDKDADERKELDAGVKALVGEMAALGAEGVEFGALAGLRQRIEALREKAAQTGGDVSGIFDVLDKVREGIMVDLRSFFIQNNLKDSLADFERMEESYRRYVAVYHNPVMAQMHRQDSPITPEEAVATILSEDAETIRLIFEGFNEETMKEFKEEAARLLKDVRERKEMTPQLEEKIKKIFPQGL